MKYTLKGRRIEWVSDKTDFQHRRQWYDDGLLAITVDSLEVVRDSRNE